MGSRQKIICCEKAKAATSTSKFSNFIKAKVDCFPADRKQ